MQFLYSLYAITTFVVLFFFFFPFFVLFSFLGHWGKKVIWYLVKIWSYIWLFIIGIFPRRTFKVAINKQHNYVVVGNHISYLDTAMIFRTMPFFCRILAKKELVNIPIFGFLYKQLAVLVDRSDEVSKRKSALLLEGVLKQQSSIFIFPEGSFNESNETLKHFYDGAFRLAIQTQTPILPVVFPDTVKRFHYSSMWKWTPGKCRAIFLEPVEVKGYELSELNVLKEKVKIQMTHVLQVAQNKSIYKES